VRQLRLKHREPSRSERDILDEQPETDEAVSVCVEAWHDLHSERPLGMAGAGLIPWRSMLEWARFHGLDREAAKVLITVLRKLDHDRAEREASKAALKG
jgi:hypothetical protein